MSATVPQIQTDGVVVRRLGADRFRVERGGRALGFVEVYGSVYVSLAGPVEAFAVEVAQSLDRDTAVRAVMAAEHQGGARSR